MFRINRATFKPFVTFKFFSSSSSPESLDIYFYNQKIKGKQRNKSCLNCAYYIENDESEKYKSKKEIKDNIKLESEYYHYLYDNIGFCKYNKLNFASICRLNRFLCGEEAKWYTPKK